MTFETVLAVSLWMLSVLRFFSRIVFFFGFIAYCMMGQFGFDLMFYLYFRKICIPY